MDLRASKSGLLWLIMSAWLAIVVLVLGTSALIADEAEESTAEDSTKTKVTASEADVGEEAVEGEEVAEGEEATEEEEASDGSMEQIIVTGSRLPEGDPAALVHTYSEDQILATGAANLEEFFRTLPWQFSSFNSQTSYIFNTGDTAGYDSGRPAYTMDLSTVNLRSLGSGNTLVLLNGRRIAGYAGVEDDFANILGIPLDAIERVEIQLDGGSAVYGADAIAGVVNFITKKNYRGLTANFKQETSNTGGDLQQGGATAGLGWKDGNVTIVLSMNEREPIINSKTGWTSRDYRALLGPEFDYRLYSYSQPGIVREWNGNLQYPSYDWLNPSTYQLPPDHSGVGATIEDFRVNEIHPYDKIPLENGAHANQESITIAFKQHFFDDKVRTFLDVLYQQNFSFQRNELTYTSILVPASNAYNPFGRHVHVSYIPAFEHENGLLPTPTRNADSNSHNVTGGVTWNWRAEQEIEFSWTESRSRRAATLEQISTRRPRHDPSSAAFYNALSSSDPATALNFFGNGTVQGASFSDLLTEVTRNEGRTATSVYNILAKGALFQLWGDTISYSVGAEKRATRIINRYQSSWSWTTTDFDTYDEYIGVAEPTQRAEAYFVETAIPVIGPSNPQWWAKSLYLTIQNRYDVNWTWGSAGGVDIQSNLPYSEWPVNSIEVWDPETNEYTTIEVPLYPEPETQLNLVRARQSKQSPRVGIRYKPTEDVVIRLSWSRAFQLPLPSQLFDTWDDTEWFFTLVDPYDPDGPQQVRVPYTYKWYNDKLKPESSDTRSVSVQWTPSAIEGLLMEFDWSTVDFQNRVENSSSLVFNNPEIAFLVPGIAERNERGDLVHLTFGPLNVSEKRNTLIEGRVSYRFGMGSLGTFEPELRYTRTLEDFTLYAEGVPPLSKLGTQETGDRYRTQLTLYWDRNNVRGNLFVRYRPGYLNDKAHYCSFTQVGVGRCDEAWKWISLEVGSLTTVDATLTYRMENNLEFNFGGRNILNRDAPNTIRGGVPYDPTRWDARGRVLSMGLKYSL